jgi:hypothetical protein
LQLEDLERHLVHLDNHGCSVSDPRIDPENIGKEQNMAAHQRNEEWVKRCLNKWDIAVLLGEYLPEAVDSIFHVETHVGVDKI